MTGRDVYRLAVAHWTGLVASTRSWPDAVGVEREPFREAPHRAGLEDGAYLPASASNRMFQVFLTGVGPYGGQSHLISGSLRDRLLSFSVVVAYLLGGGMGSDERDVRTLAIQDAEAIAQRLTHPTNRTIAGLSDGSGIAGMAQSGLASVSVDEDRLILSIPFEAHMRVYVEPSEGAIAA